MSIVPLAQLFAGERPADHPIALFKGHPVTLARLRAEVAHDARLLTDRGVRRGVLACEDGYHFLVGLLALLGAGADVVLPPNTQPGALKAAAAEADLIVGDLVLAGDGGFVVGQGGSDAALVLGGHQRIEVFTSGSTGEVKRITKTLGQFEREAAVLERLWGERLGAARIVATVTHQHVYGMTFRIFWPLFAGRCFSGTVHAAWETLLDELAPRSAVISSPAHLSRLGGIDRLPDEIGGCTVVTAGAPLPAAAGEEVGRLFGSPPIEIFGSTETGVVAWRNDPADAPLWRAFPEVEIATDEDGLLRVRSPHADGMRWCPLADRVALRPDGRFVFEGRADRIVKIEGKRVSLQELERAIAGLSSVAEAAVAPLGGERPFLGAVVTLTEDGRALLTQHGKFRFERLLRRELATLFDGAVLPRRWRFVERMPMDGMGKRRLPDLVALVEGA